MLNLQAQHTEYCSWVIHPFVRSFPGKAGANGDHARGRVGQCGFISQQINQKTQVKLNIITSLSL